MQRFYTHLDNGHGYQKDEEGTLFENAQQAREHALRSGADILADEIKQGCSKLNLTLYIEDASHRAVAALPMSALIGCEEKGSG